MKFSSQSVASTNLQGCIGTVNVTILDCGDMALDPSVSRADMFCTVQLDRQQQKTRNTALHVVPREPHRVRWNQSFMFSVQNLDQELVFSVYMFDKYSQDGTWIFFARNELNVDRFHWESVDGPGFFGILWWKGDGEDHAGPTSE